MTREYSLRISVVALAVLVIGSLVMTTSAQAATTAFGRKERYGYFDNKFGHSDSPYKDGGGPVVDNGGDYTSNNAMPKSVNTKNEFWNWLKSRYSGSDNGKFGHSTWDKRGIAFIVNTMIGRNGSAGDKSLDGGEWDELHDRLYNPDVTIDPGTYSSKNFGGVDTFYQYGNQDVSWYDNDNESGAGIAFRYKGKIVYVILHECANPLGDLPGLPNYNPPCTSNCGGTPPCTSNCGGTPDPGCTSNCTPVPDPKVWSIGVSTSANLNQTTKRVEFTHFIRNNGPDTTDADVAYAYVNGANTGSGNGPSNTYVSGHAAGDAGAISFASSVNYGDADAGKTYCRATTANPGGADGAPGVTSAQACVTIPFNYSLKPTVTFAGGGTSASIDPGSDGVNLSYGVYNQGPTPSQPNTAWELTRCRYAPSAPYPTQTTETDSPGGAAAVFGGACTSSAAGSGQFGAGVTTGLGSLTEDAEGQPTGTHLCYVLSVRPPSSTLGGNRYSIPACVVVLKSPKIQVWSGDIRAGKAVTRGSVTADGKKYGSWAEYGIFGLGPVGGIGSASVYANGCQPGPLNNCNDAARLTFANGSSLGSFIAPSNEGYVTAYRNTGGAAIGGTLAGVTSGTYTQGGDLTIGGPVANGVHAVVTVTGNLRISSNITYGGTYGTVADIPRVIFVVDGDITVDPGVTQIDAWLISSGTLYTCGTDISATRAKLTTNDCDKQLTFNGPVYVDSTRLSRTYGADIANREQAAEIFNLRPDIFLSSYGMGVSSTSIQTVYETELSPRW